MYQLLGQQSSVGAEALIILVVYISGLFSIVGSEWMIFEKAGQPGWVALVPFYNIRILLKITGKPARWLVWYFVPIVFFFVPLIVTVELAKKFGKRTGFGFGLFLLPFVFLPILGFGDAVYQPEVTPATPPVVPEA